MMSPERLDALFEELGRLQPPRLPTDTKFELDPTAGPSDPRSPNRALQVLEILREALGDDRLRDALAARGMSPESADEWLAVLRRRRQASTQQREGWSR